MTENFHCLLCDGHDAELVFAQCRDYYLGTSHVVDYVRCKRCRLLQQSPLPQDTASLYSDYPVHLQKSAAFRLLRRLVMSNMYFSPENQAPLTLLDYGCGDGGFLDTLRKRDNLRLLGYEPSSAQAERVQAAIDVPIYSSYASLLAAEKDSIDVLTLHMVLEHVLDPGVIFENARQLLKPQGMMYVVVPDAESLEARIFGKMWHNLDAPRHISFPAKPHLQELASRYEFELVRDRPAAFPNGFAASLATVMAGRFRFGLFALFLPLGLLFSRLAPTGSHAYWLRKR